MSDGRWPGGNLRERLLMRVEEADDGCWNWTGGTDPEGRGVFGPHTRFAYRLLYEELVGPIPDGLVLDHYVCQNPACVNPGHLEPVTAAENTRRYYQRLTHCRRGHPWNEENTAYQKRGRLCRACRRESQRNWYRRKTHPPEGGRMSDDRTVFVDGTRVTPGSEGCRCDQDGRLCEWPCWQRIGLTSEPCCPDCAPLPDPDGDDRRAQPRAR